jgi:predicted PurR-regulated permease PerM
MPGTALGGCDQVAALAREIAAMNWTNGGTATLARWFMASGLAGASLLFLVFGRSFLVPLVIGVLIFSLMSAIIHRVSRIHLGAIRIPYWLASSLGVAAVGFAMFAIYSILAGQLQLMIAALPKYTMRGQEIIASLSEWLGHDVGEAIRVAYGNMSLLASLRALAAPAGYAISTIVLIILYVAFLFVERGHTPTKFALLFSDVDRAERVSGVISLIVRSVHRYLFVKAIISVGTGLAAYLVMRLIGLEFAETWAVLTVLLNFIPNVGSIVATVLPCLMALVQFDSWPPIVLTIAGVGAVQVVGGNAVDPLLMGRTLNLSSFVIVLSLAFWAAVWGIIGMFLAVPIMAVMLIICAHVHGLRPVAILLSSDGVLPAADKPEPF